MKTQISASILSANFANLGEDLLLLERSGADMIHIDVMDGHFVPNITIGSCVIKSIRPITKLPFDVHLMIDNPMFFLEEFAKAGANLITVHYELNHDISLLLDKIKYLGCRAGLSVMPSTPIESIYSILHKCDLVLIMTVMPGFAGQEFMMDQLQKISKLSSYITKKNYEVMISVDGGINADSARLAIDAGANIIVSGSYIFGAKNIKEAINSCRG